MTPSAGRGPLRWRALVGALSLLASAAPAQSTGLRVRSGPPTPFVTEFGYYLGPFSGALTSDPTQPEVDLYLVGVLNRIQWDQTWSSNFGGGSPLQIRQAMYMATMYQLVGVPWQQWSSIQNAVWYAFPSPGGNGTGDPNGPSGSGSDPDQGGTDGGQGGSGESGGPGGGESGDEGGTPANPGGSTGEDAMTTAVTPEPETWVLMGTGLVLILGVSVRRGSLL